VKEVVIRHIRSTDGWKDLHGLEVVVDGQYVDGGTFQDSPREELQDIGWILSLFEDMALAVGLVPRHEEIDLPIEAFLDRLESS
jgi:hypothetical protein